VGDGKEVNEDSRDRYLFYIATAGSFKVEVCRCFSSRDEGTGTNDTWMMDEGRRLMEDGRGMM
jgi:hypothetical protein